jgi:hypothetical protein
MYHKYLDRKGRTQSIREHINLVVPETKAPTKDYYPNKTKESLHQSLM